MVNVPSHAAIGGCQHAGDHASNGILKDSKGVYERHRKPTSGGGQDKGLGGSRLASMIAWHAGPAGNLAAIIQRGRVGSYPFVSEAPTVAVGNEPLEVIGPAIGAEDPFATRLEARTSACSQLRCRECRMSIYRLRAVRQLCGRACGTGPRT